jgi:hypothetical protein
MKCQKNVNSILPTQLSHTFSYIGAILIHNHFESSNTIPAKKFRPPFSCHFTKIGCSLTFIVIMIDVWELKSEIYYCCNIKFIFDINYSEQLL